MVDRGGECRGEREEYEGFANLITFCPNCNTYVYLDALLEAKDIVSDLLQERKI